MKFAFVMHNLVRGNGQGRIQYEIVRHALSLGHSLTLFASRVDPSLVEAGAEWVHVSESARLPNLLSGYSFAAAADRILSKQRIDFDIIVAAGFTMRGPHDVSICQFVHGAWMRSLFHASRAQRGPLAWYQWLYSRCNSRWERQSFSAARKVVAPSQRTVDELIGIGVPQAKIELINNAVDLEEFHPGKVSRPSLGLPDGKPTALFCGDIRTPRKNLDTVLKALAQVSGVHLAVVGDTRRSPFPQMARSCGIADRVHFLGFRRDVAEIMRACDFFVFPTRYEPFGNVVLEAMATGIPVIVSAAAGAAEVLGDADPDCRFIHAGEERGGIVWTKAGAILQNVEDVDGLGAIMRCFAEDPDQLRQRGSAARRIAENHSWQKMAEQYLELFESLAPGRAALIA
jgi:glycosyltransferase involved in cell wall biosynthesis